MYRGVSEPLEGARVKYDLSQKNMPGTLRSVMKVCQAAGLTDGGTFITTDVMQCGLQELSRSSLQSSDDGVIRLPAEVSAGRHIPIIVNIILKKRLLRPCSATSQKMKAIRPKEFIHV